MGKIRIGIVGYGNIGRGVEQSIKRNDDMELKVTYVLKMSVLIILQVSRSRQKEQK